MLCTTANNKLRGLVIKWDLLSCVLYECVEYETQKEW